MGCSVRLAGLTKHVWRAHVYYDADFSPTHIGYASKMALGSVLDALSDTRLATSSSLVTKHFTFDRSFIEHITVNK